MARRKLIRTRGKISFSRYFQNLEKGDSVAVVKEPAIQSNFPTRLQGRVGLIEGKRGKAYIIKFSGNSKEKQFLIEPIHLKKIKQDKK
jgi:large subunit ribosomal protein L21e